MKVLGIILTLCFSFTAISGNAQSFKDHISIVQYSAPFTKGAEISLKPFKDHQIYTFCITEKKDIFENENIKYLPTLVLYHNGEEVVRVESGITLKLPENSEVIIQTHIDKIVESKF